MKKYVNNHFFLYKVLISVDALKTLKTPIYFSHIVHFKENSFYLGYGTKKLVKEVEKAQCGIYSPLLNLFFHHKVGLRIIQLFLFIITFLMFSVSNVKIKKIQFKESQMYDLRIMNVLSEYDNFNYINLNEIEHHLLSSLKDYEYITLSRKGSILFVDTKRVKELKKIEEDCPFKSIVSKKDGYIVGLEVTSGKKSVSLYQIVKKGEELISGSIEDASSKTNIVSPKGAVLAEVINKEKIVVKKTMKEFVYTGKVLSKTFLSVKDNYIKKLNQKNEYSSVILFEKLKIFPFIKIYEMKEYEKKECLLVLDEDSLYEYVTFLLYSTFEQNRTHESEKIVSLKIINVTNLDMDFVVEYEMKCIENIAIGIY